MNKEQLIHFENKIKDMFLDKQIKGPIHLSGGNEDQLIEIFKEVGKEDWVFSGHRNHYHALLKGIPPAWLTKQIKKGKSMLIMNRKHRFMASAIVGGTIPIAVGVAVAIKRKSLRRRVWIFTGDGGMDSGRFFTALRYAHAHKLPIKFVIEDNRYSCDTPYNARWNGIPLPIPYTDYVKGYHYKLTYPHTGVGEFVSF